MVAWSSGPSAPAPRAPSPSGPSSGPRWSPPRTRTSESRGGRILWVPESRSRLLPGLSSSGSRLRPNSGWFPPVIAKTRGNREEQRGKPRHPGRGPSRSAQFRRTVSQFRSAGSTQRTVRGQTFVTKRSPEVGTFFATCSLGSLDSLTCRRSIRGMSSRPPNGLTSSTRRSPGSLGDRSPSRPRKSRNAGNRGRHEGRRPTEPPTARRPGAHTTRTAG